MGLKSKNKVVFVSNYLNHHQLPFCKEMLKKTNDSFVFVATTPVPSVRKQLGYHDMNDMYDFVLKAYESKENASNAVAIINEADIVVYGWGLEAFVKQRIKKKKITFKYTERLYKKEPKWYTMFPRKIKYYFTHNIHKKLFLLCAGAYVADDYARTKTFIGKAYKWGYFPEVKEYEDIDIFIDDKKENSLLWCGRIIDWKHPEYAVEVARRLKSEGYKFDLNMIGTGNLYAELVKAVLVNNLDDCVHILGSMSPEAVREYMEKSEIFLFTSDRQEGWGAVLNESMNSACAVVANNNIGAVPYLLNDGKNGAIYHNDSVDELYEKVKYLLDNREKRKEMGKNAYNTMKNEWNATVATERLLILAEELKNNKKCTLYEGGPCSVAEVHKRKK
ncbi:MAG: glycosyltransferase family 4 protein [Clostridia bacterium]|nr:glycosyltransferase family 4 protein [Clostridia bacterium]